MQPSTDAISQHPNTLFVAAAGNDGTDNDVIPQDPCDVPLPNVLCVAAIDASGNLASFSNYGATSVDVAAPGVGIQSTVPNFATAFAPAVEPDRGTPPLPDGWVQTPAGEWTFETTSSGLNYMELVASPGPAGAGLVQWAIAAPSTFNPVGWSCRMNADIATVLNGQDQLVALAYTTDQNPTPAYLGVTTSSTGGNFIPWVVDLSAIEGQTGVQLGFIVQSAKGAASLLVATTAPVVTCIVDQPAGGSYAFLSGTSMASPQVAGAAALLLAKNPDLTAAQMKHALMSTTVPMASLAGKVVTGGRVDVNAALASVPARAVPAAPAAPAAPAPTTTALTLRAGSTIAIRPGGTRASVPVTCAQPSTATCAVTVALRMRVATAGSTRVRWIPLGTQRATLPGTWQGRVSVPLTQEARNLLGRHGRVRTTVIASSQTGSETLTSVRQTTTLVRR
ncbi:MAG: S8 family serine peptidase [Miltoncostaeaceae bacterium]